MALTDTSSQGAQSLNQVARQQGLIEQAEREVEFSDKSAKFITPEGDEVIRDTSAKPASPLQYIDADEIIDDSETQKTKIPINIEPNKLSNYETVSYNFRLFMTSELATHETMRYEDIIAVAETGSTGFNIKDVSIDTIISPSRATKNTFATNVIIKIVEPFGSSLFDYIRNSAAELQVSDHRSAPMWLQLSFKGYNAGEEESYTGGDIADLSKETRLWRIRVKKVDVEITYGGTEYSLHCIAQDEAGLEDSARLLKSDVYITAGTLGEFLTELSRTLNSFTDYKTTVKSDRIENVVRYRFIFPEDPLPAVAGITDEEARNFLDTERRELHGLSLMKNWKIRGEKTVETIKSEATVNGEAQKGKNKFSFSKGTSVEAIIHQILSSTKEAQSLLNFGEPGRRIDDGRPRDASKSSMAFTVEPTVEFLSYNGLAKAYNIEVTYHIRPYRTFIPVISHEQIKDSQDTTYIRKRLENKIKICNLKKKYEYIFTGLNTEVLDYKIELNSAWFISLPIFRGQSRSSQAETSRNDNNVSGKGYKGQIDQTKDESKEESAEDIQKKLRSLQMAADDETDEDIAARQPQIAALQSRVAERANIPLRAGRVATSTTSYGIAEKRLSIQNDSVIPGTVTGNVTSNVTIIETDPATTKVRENNRRIRGSSTGSIFFAEDIDTISDSAKKANKQINNNEDIRHVGAQSSPTSSTIDRNVEGEKDPDRSFFHNSMNQLYGFKGQLINLEMEIKGDPYWLGEPNTRKRLLSSDGAQDLTKSDAMLLLIFKLPIKINDGDDTTRSESYSGTGFYEARLQQNGFNGLYNVTKVENNFSGGKFTQKLIGYIDPLTKEKSLIDELDLG